MEHLVQYASSDDEADVASSKQQTQDSVMPLPVVNSAPIVVVANPEIASATSQFLVVASQKHLSVNLPVESTLAPYVGPANAYARNAQLDPAHVGSGKEIVTGIVEKTNMEDFNFDAQYHTYNQSHTGMYLNKRSAQDGGETQAADAIISHNEENVFTTRNVKKRKNHTIAKEKAAAEEFGDDSVDGIWAPYTEKSVVTDAEAGTMTAEQEAIRDAHIATKKQKSERSMQFDEEMDFDRMIEKKMAHLLPARLKAGQEAMAAKTQFLDTQEYDYQGRSWIEPPRALRPDEDGDHQVFLPKRCVHKWTGHTKGVQAIELFPSYGHLLLSGSMDHTVRIWDVYNEKRCKRVYEGHSGAVRGINFSNDGKQFLSCGFDRFIQLWDTETGQSIKSFTNRRVPYCVKFYPGDNNNFVIGDSNNMIVQFDARSGEIVQEYNHHLQAVNSVTFVDDNRRFVSTSDDKKILIWEWGIPVPVKYISEPSMHSMPAVTLHPSGAFFAGQSLNNQIDVYTARDKFKLQRKKVFKGHSNAGYACQIGFSPNGQYIMSGDAEGRLCFWDWKSTKMYKKLRAHDRGPCMGALWHPIEPSKVVSCGWDGLIKYWD
ncbi:putative pre-mrna splicing factor, partial [Globisporangium splendens]